MGLDEARTAAFVLKKKVPKEFDKLFVLVFVDFTTNKIEVSI